jgi:hypothetical protein
MTRFDTPEQQALQAYVNANGFTKDGLARAVCQRCAEARPVQTLSAVPVPAEQLLIERSDYVCVCVSCKRRMRRVA